MLKQKKKLVLRLIYSFMFQKNILSTKPDIEPDVEQEKPEKGKQKENLSHSTTILTRQN